MQNMKIGISRRSGATTAKKLDVQKSVMHSLQSRCFANLCNLAYCLFVFIVAVAVTVV